VPCRVRWVLDVDPVRTPRRSSGQALVGQSRLQLACVVRFAFRLALLPVIVAVGAGWAVWTGMAWPIGTTFARCLMPQPDTAESEPDPPC
jgi:hypothetical protein